MPFVDAQPELRITVARLTGRAHVATVSGELDLSNAETLRERLWPLSQRDGSTLIVDLSGVTFIDSTALGVLTGAAKLLRAGDGRLIVTTDDPRLRRLLEITGLLSVIDHETTLAAAVERVVGPRA